MEQTKETLEYSGNTEVIGLQIRETGERIAFVKPANYARAEYLVKCWNAFEEGGLVEGLVGACEAANIEIITALEIPTDKRLEKDKENLIYVIRDMLHRTARGQQILKAALAAAKEKQ